MNNVVVGAVTGTRADFGKLKPVLKLLEQNQFIDLTVFATGMHLHQETGNTLVEVQKEFGDKCLALSGQEPGESQLAGLANLLSSIERSECLSGLDFLIVHGDRIDALGFAIAAKLSNICLIHIEGGEVSGSIDERIRHSVTKFADWHLVANAAAAKRVMQLGESKDTVIETGSPEATVILSGKRPGLAEVRARYNIPFHEYAVLTFHPVVGDAQENQELGGLLIEIVSSIANNFVIIGSNTDDGYKPIRDAGLNVECLENVVYFPNIRFEYYLTLLQNAAYAIGIAPHLYEKHRYLASPR